MKKYTKPEINVCRFDAQDIITESAALPAPATEYKPSDAENFSGATYIFDWNE